MIIVNKAIAQILSKYGYELKKKKKRKFLAIDNYSQAIYSRGDIFFEIDINIACNFNQFFFGKENWHYHTKMVEDIMLDFDIPYEGSILQHYYRTYQPNNFYDLYFVTKEPSNLGKSDRSILNNNINEYKYDLWSDFPYKVEMNKPHEYGLLRRHGTQHYGPVSKKKGELEIKRLKDTYRSINEQGFDPSKHGYLSGYFLKYKDNFRFIILDGNHRAAVLAAMNYEKVPVIFQPNFPRVIDFNNIKSLPLVRRGLFSFHLAKQIFLSYFEDNGVIKAQKLGLVINDSLHKES